MKTKRFNINYFKLKNAITSDGLLPLIPSRLVGHEWDYVNDLYWATTDRTRQPLLHACAEDQLAYEYQHGATNYGAFTYRLVQSLRSLKTSGATMTPANLLSRLRSAVGSEGLGFPQIPQLVAPTKVAKQPFPLLTPKAFAKPTQTKRRKSGKYEKGACAGVSDEVPLIQETEIAPIPVAEIVYEAHGSNRLRYQAIEDVRLRFPSA